MYNEIRILIILCVQIIIESLPVSSSAHVFLISSLLSGSSLGMLPQHFDELLHGPTIIIIMIFFRRAWVPLGFGLLKRCLSRDATFFRILRLGSSIAGLIMVSDCITTLFYVCLKRLDVADNISIMFGGLMITTILLASLYWVNRYRSAERVIFDWKQAIVLGVVQGCALVPGISRFASTYVASRWLGIEERRAFQLSFLLQFPLLIAGFFIHGVRGVINAGGIPWFGFHAGGVVVLASSISYVLFCLMRELARRDLLWVMAFYMCMPLALALFLVL